MRHTTSWLATTILAAAALAGCGGGGGGGTTAADGQGALRVALTDAPACGYDNVFVTVDRVRVHTSGSAQDSEAGWNEIVLNPARRIDLLTLTNGVLAELGATTLPAGNYTQIRLVLAENNNANPLANAVKPTGGAVVPLATPSAQQSGLKLQANMRVEPNQTTDVVLDFDACKSVVRAGNSGRYNLKPVVAVLPAVSSSIQGYVTTTLTLSETTVSAQQGGTVVRATVPDASGRFSLPFLAAGSYDVVIASPGRSTAVVTSVPVGTATGAVTTVSGTATSIVPPVSPMREVTGTLSVVSGTTATTATTPVTDGAVAARQTLGTTTVEVRQTSADADTGAWRLNLPTAAPVRAPFTTTLPLAFTAEAAAAGKYTLSATSPGRTALQQALDLTAATTPPVTFTFAP